MILEAMSRLRDPVRAEQSRAYHKIDRTYLGLRNAQIDDVIRPLRKSKDVSRILGEVDELWSSNIYEARVAAGKLLTLPKLSYDDDRRIWQKTLELAPDFDCWAIADHMAIAAHKRLLHENNRWVELEAWTGSSHLWRKRAALVYTLPIAKQKNHEALNPILGWAASYTLDREWFVQKAVAWWLREHSKVAPDTVAEFLRNHGSSMKAFAVKEAGKYL